MDGVVVVVEGDLRHGDVMLVIHREQEGRPVHEKLSEMRSWEGCYVSWSRR